MVSESLSTGSRPAAKISRRGTVLVTGASGFVGGHVGKRLAIDGYRIRGVLHTRSPAVEIQDAEWFRTGAIAAGTDWSDALSGVEWVLHAAGRVHVPDDSDADAFYRVNRDGTLQLARAAVRAGVRRFVFVSTVAVHGNGEGDRATSESSPFDPRSHYAESKLQAEHGLLEVGESGEMEVVIVRPPVVYGPGAPGNFHRLVRLVRTGVPLPLRTVTNRRSMVGIDNLSDFLTTCIGSSAAGNERFIVADEEALSISEIVSLIAGALGRNPRLFGVPFGLLEWAARVVGVTDEFQKLCGSFCLDIRKSRGLLGWVPPVSAEEGIERAVRGGA